MDMGDRATTYEERATRLREASCAVRYDFLVLCKKGKRGKLQQFTLENSCPSDVGDKFDKLRFDATRAGNLYARAHIDPRSGRPVAHGNDEDLKRKAVELLQRTKK